MHVEKRELSRAERGPEEDKVTAPAAAEERDRVGEETVGKLERRRNVNRGEVSCDYLWVCREPEVSIGKERQGCERARARGWGRGGRGGARRKVVGAAVGEKGHGKRERERERERERRREREDHDHLPHRSLAAIARDRCSSRPQQMQLQEALPKTNALKKVGHPRVSIGGGWESARVRKEWLRARSPRSRA